MIYGFNAVRLSFYMDSLGAHSWVLLPIHEFDGTRGVGHATFFRELASTSHGSSGSLSLGNGCAYSAALV